MFTHGERTSGCFYFVDKEKWHFEINVGCEIRSQTSTNLILPLQTNVELY